MLQEIVLQEFSSRGSASDVDTETNRQESLEFLAEFLRVLEAWSTVRSDQVECLEGFLIQIRWLGFDHLNRHNTQRPDVDLRAVLLLFDHFRSHPVWSTNHGCTLGLRLGELRAETEIGNFDISPGIKKNVIGFDITMDDILCVQVLKSLAGLETDRGDLFLSDVWVVVNDIG